MAGKLISSLTAALLKLEDAITSAIFPKLHPGLCIAGLDTGVEVQKSKFTVQDLIGDGLVWAVPKHRRCVERRLSRKFGWPKYNWKPLVPKTSLIMCRKCGHFHECDTICGNCYQKVKEETLEIQKAIQQEYKLDPVKEDIVVLYEDEKELNSSEFWKGQRIVEMPKKRPSWFQQNLLEKTTQPLSDSKEVKPNDLA